ncbi:proteasome assembly chaperone family protein [Candidatus Micrarchaeota archaeon]|nr:proteasome assembly chaperone family protein [Candidatus Micrarchaeota archaeon]
MHIEYKELKPLSIKGATMLVGFPTSGLVGSIAASYLANRLEMEMVGYFRSEKMPPVTAIHDYKPMPPLRVYKSDRYNLVVVLSEIVTPISLSSEMASEISKIAEKIKSPLLITLGGISLHQDEESVYGISTSEELVASLEKRGQIKRVKEGATTGVAGLLLTPGIAKTPVLSLLAETLEEQPDPKAAANVLKIVAKILKIKLDTGELEEEAKILSQATREAVLSSKKTKRKQLGQMYG